MCHVLPLYIALEKKRQLVHQSAVIDVQFVNILYPLPVRVSYSITFIALLLDIEGDDVTQRPEEKKNTNLFCIYVFQIR